MSYHMDFEYLSKSFLMKLDISPLHAYHYMTAEVKKDTPAMKFGRCYHAAIAGEKYAIIDESQRPEQDKTMASNANKAWKREIEERAQLEKLDIITADEHLEIMSMIEAIEANEIVRKINAFELKQEEVFKAEVNGRKLKCKPDGLQIGRGKDKENLIIDWKTCTDIHPKNIMWDVPKYGYDVQAALYCDVISAIHGGESNMLFIFQEKSAPYDVLPVLVKQDSDSMTYGRDRYQRYYDKARECMTTGEWPGVASNYSEKIMIL
jgi:hypothetical protein